MVSSVLIDIGNSRLKWALKHYDRLELGRPLPFVDGIFDFDRIWENLEPPSRILVSNVLGENITQSLKQWVQNHWSAPVEIVRSCEYAHGVSNGYLKPDRLGVDRWICMIAARALYKEPVCVVDCGTAITADVLDGLGRHQGGAICPGVKLMQDVLVRGVPKLSLEGVGPGGLLGRDTGAGIYSGTLTAAAGLIEKFLQEAEQFMRTRLKLLITGGDACLVAEKLAIGHVHIPDMVLKGLALIESGGDFDALSD
ncbi:MAG: type III pantothenate kinase [Methylococcales bacterium]